MYLYSLSLYALKMDAIYVFRVSLAIKIVIRKFVNT